MALKVQGAGLGKQKRQAAGPSLEKGLDLGRRPRGEKDTKVMARGRQFKSEGRTTGAGALRCPPAPSQTPCCCPSDLSEDPVPGPTGHLDSRTWRATPSPEPRCPPSMNLSTSLKPQALSPDTSMGSQTGFTILTSIGVNWGALKKDTGGSIAERPIHHVAVSCNPANVSHTAEDVTWPVVEHKLQRQEGSIRSLSPHSTMFTRSLGNQRAYAAGHSCERQLAHQTASSSRTGGNTAESV